MYGDGDAVWVLDGPRGRCASRWSRRAARRGRGRRRRLAGGADAGDRDRRPRASRAPRSREGDVLVVLESMKMEISIHEPARRGGRRGPRRRRRPGRPRRDARRAGARGLRRSRPAASHANGQWNSSTRRRGVDETQLATRRAGTEFERNEAEHRRLVGRAARAAGPRRGGRRREGARGATSTRGKLLPRERVDRLLDPGSALPRALAARRRGPLRRRRAGRRDHHRRRPGRGPRGRRRRQRRHRQRRHLLPDDGEEAPAGAGGGAAEPAALRLPGRLGRRLPADAGRGLPRPRALRPHLLQPGDDVGAAGSRRSPR